MRTAVPKRLTALLLFTFLLVQSFPALAQADGGHDSLGAAGPRKEWYFAEGTTRNGFTTYLAVMNPASVEAVVDFTYMLGSGDPVMRSHRVEPESRFTLDLESDVGPGVDVSTHVESSLPVIAERPLYFANRAGRTVTVCLDPGHSVSEGDEIDQATGLNVGDNTGAAGELEAMWDLACRSKDELERAGFEVRLTKTAPYEYVDLRTRAEIGNTCSIMVRLHFDPGGYEGVMRPPPNAARCPVSDPSRVTVIDAAVAAESDELARYIAPALGLAVRDDTGGTSRGNGTPPGHPTCLIGSVLSRVPVVCIENRLVLARDPAGRSRIAEELVRGIEEYFSAGR
jgi:N-acetylmuramoyl-L-alanine amidase